MLLVLAILSAIAVSSTLGTFVSRTYARISEDESARFHFYVMSDQPVRFRADTEMFDTSFYPPYLDGSCRNEAVMYWKGEYKRACRVEVLLRPREGIVTGRYRVPIYVETVPSSGEEGISMKVSLVRQVNFEIDVEGRRIFMPPEPIDLPRAVTRVVFSQPAEEPEPRQKASSEVRIIGTPEEPAVAPTEEIRRVTGLVIREQGPGLWMLIVAGGILLIALRVLGWI